MSQSELRRRMRGNDAMFLYLERKEMPLHIGAVAILDGPFDEESERLLAARLPEIPRYRQRVVFPALNLTHPSWEYDPNFDIRNHIRRVKLPAPGTDQQLSQLSGTIFTELMDRSKPLWDVTVVDGVEGGRSALILRVHHCLVDGVSGMALVNVMFDPTREPRRVEPKPYSPPPLPEPRQVLVEGLSGFWADTAERLIGTQLNILRLAQAFTGETSSQSLKALLATMPELIRPTERLPFNQACSGVRGHCWTVFPFGEARAIRSALGGTINDVVLTVVTGAFSRYVNAHREPVKNRFVRMMVPVNLRAEDPRGSAVGNDISMVPLSVPLDIDDPAERLRVVTMRSGAMKAARIADLIHLIGTSLGWMTPNLQQSLGALPFLPQGPVLIVNTVCTNVPGPMVPLYSNGREVLTYHPHVPCGCEAGLTVAISSYNQNLSYGVTYDMQAAPDGELFRDFLVESYEELRAAAGVRPTPASKPAERPKAQAAAAPDLRGHRAPAASPEAAKETAPEPKATAAAAAEPAPAAKAVPEPVIEATAEPAPEPAPEVVAASAAESVVEQAPPPPAAESTPSVSAGPVSVPEPVVVATPPAPVAPAPEPAKAKVKVQAESKPAPKPAAPAPRPAMKPAQDRKATGSVAIIPPKVVSSEPPPRPPAPEPKGKGKKSKGGKVAKATAGTH